MATLAARSASGPSATTVTVSPSISAEPASTAPSASDTRIRVRGGRRSRSSRAGSSITHRPRSLISGRFASASAATSSASSSAPSSVSCHRKSSSAASPNPASVTLPGAGVGMALSLRPPSTRLDGHSTSMPAPASSSAAGPSRLVSASSSRPITDGLACSSASASGGQIGAPRRSASSRSVSACAPNLDSTVSGWFHSAAASTIRLGSALLLSCRTSRNAGVSPSASSGTCAPYSSTAPGKYSSSSARSSSSPTTSGAGTASIRRPRRAPAARPSVVSASHSARSPTRVGSAAANAVEAVVRAAAGERAIRSAIASHRSRISASGERSRIGREPGMARACAVGGKTAASSRSQLRSDGSSGPARQTSASSAPTVGSSLPRATRPTPAAAAAAQTRALRRIGRPARWSGSMARSTGRASAERDEIRRHQALADAVPAAGEHQLQLADPEPLPQCANTPRRGISPGTKTSSPSSTEPYDTGRPVGLAGLSAEATASVDRMS